MYDRFASNGKINPSPFRFQGAGKCFLFGTALTTAFLTWEATLPTFERLEEVSDAFFLGFVRLFSFIFIRLIRFFFMNPSSEKPRIWKGNS
ncbi:hypothetical protein LEP1GSC058_3677 [Leptospira fainei serovar Hurstbridge str. BUT 6]|uniref:Uncharacterized protein n=1 Tax=Leptospira fainei serovar Hurstbridge str. BUT 6 TaxID=1193011 RepID=S3UYQ1_9LEPT|nr:hypothetical protein LEP1GSC058_3677 [Leptospira fainei serovar Hurstbridge str. BUT 6]